jgi:hypothetical protein
MNAAYGELRVLVPCLLVGEQQGAEGGAQGAQGPGGGGGKGETFKLEVSLPRWRGFLFSKGCLGY